MLVDKYMAKETKLWGSIKETEFLGPIWVVMPLLAGGLLLLIVSLDIWRVYHDSGEWEKVPARIESSSFKVHHEDDGTSYSVRCSYSYNYAGKNYHGSKVEMVGFSNECDHRRRYDIINRHKTENKPFDALVNPLDPSQSVLFREITTTMYIVPMVGLVFGLAGAAVMGRRILATIKTFRWKTALTENPGQPWLVNTRWRSHIQRYNLLPKIFGTFAMTACWCLFVSCIVIAIFCIYDASLFLKIIACGVCLIPVGTFYSGVYQTIRYIKYGNPELILGQMPFVPGRLNTATLNIPARVITQEAMTVSLKCFRRDREIGEENSSIREHEEFSIDQTVIQDPSGLPNSILMSFMIPENVQQTHIGTFPEYAWRISADAKTPGVDFKVQFDVPVYFPMGKLDSPKNETLCKKQFLIRNHKAAGLSIRAHKVCTWVVPIGIILLSFPVGNFVARLFANVQGLGNIPLFVGIVVAMISKLVLQKAKVLCPQCGASLEYYPAEHSAMARYTCKVCGFRAR
jgi:predicted RNA-binding Zn-ribbon protein involved in translation (DUF1610 family)